MYVHLQRDGYSVSESMPFQVTLDTSRCKLGVRRVHVGLVRTITMKGRGANDVNQFDAEGNRIRPEVLRIRFIRMYATIIQVTLGGLAAGASPATQEGVIELGQVQNLFEGVWSSYGCLIDCQYALRFKAVLAGRCTWCMQLSLEFPVNITGSMTAPSPPPPAPENWNPHVAELVHQEYSPEWDYPDDLISDDFFR